LFVTALSVTASFFVLPEVTSFDLDGGATSVTSSMVTLDNTSSGAPLEYMASEASDFSGPTWEPYDTAPIFTLSSGGTTTVYFRVRNAAGESASVSDTIDWTEDTVLLPGNVPLEMVWIPAGTYQRGTIHRLRLAAYS